jgi:hypothetical protein
LIGYAHADGATAYLDGKGYASGTLDSSFGQVSQGNAASLPFYGASAPQQSLFGSASLFGAATGKIGSCVGYTPDPGNPTSNQECSAVNFLAKNPTQRVRFNLDPNTDPSVLAAGGVQNNAQVLSGVGNGTIGNCGTTTVTQGGQTSIEVCNQYTDMTQSRCQKNLVVKVTQQQSTVPTCTPGQLLGSGTGTITYGICSRFRQCYSRLTVYCGSNGGVTVSYQYDIPSYSGPLVYGQRVTLSDGAWVQYNCSSGATSCNVYAQGWAPAGLSPVTVSFTNPLLFSQTTQVTKSWDNQCADMEARAQ